MDFKSNTSSIGVEWEGLLSTDTAFEEKCCFHLNQRNMSFGQEPFFAYKKKLYLNNETIVLMRKCTLKLFFASCSF